MKRWYRLCKINGTLRAEKEPRVPTGHSPAPVISVLKLGLLTPNDSFQPFISPLWAHSQTFFFLMPYSLLINIKVLPLPTRVLFNPHSLHNLFLENHCYLSWIPPVRKISLNFRASIFKKKLFTFWNFPDIKLSDYFIGYFFGHTFLHAISPIR